MLITDKVVKDYAFRGDASLTKVEFGPEVEEIGIGAFFECPNLEEVIIPSTVKLVRQGAFASCFKLQKLTFDYQTIYEQDAFNACFGLKYLYNKGAEARVWSLDNSFAYIVTMFDKDLSSPECSIYIGRYAQVSKGFPSSPINKEEDIIYVAEVHKDGKDFAWFHTDLRIAVTVARFLASGKTFEKFFGIQLSENTKVTATQFSLLIGACPVGPKIWQFIVKSVGAEVSDEYSLKMILQVIEKHIPIIATRVRAMIEHHNEVFHFFDMKNLIPYDEMQEQVRNWFKAYLLQGYIKQD